MNQEPKFRYYRINGTALEILKAYKAELDALIKDREELEKDFIERAQQQTDYHQATLRSLWRRLSASVGLDPDTTWGSPEYQIEARYLEDGFGAILYMPRHTNPLREMLGGEPVADRQNPTTDTPPKDVTRH